MLSSIDDIVGLVTIQMSTTASTLSTDGLESAANSALTELGWALPISDPTQSMWVVKRALRHACFILWVASASKFKYKQVNLQHRFEQYSKLIDSMDKELETALSSQTNIFSAVASYKMFGTVCTAGFRYDYIGRDITYDDLTTYINSGE